MMGPGFFAAAFAEDLVKIVAWSFSIGMLLGMAIIVGAVLVVS